MVLPSTLDNPRQYTHGMGDTEAARLTVNRIRAFAAVSRARYAYDKATASEQKGQR